MRRAKLVVIMFKRLDVLLLVSATLVAAKDCYHKPPNCKDDSCLITWQCGEHSQCGARRGCVCLPCYTGDTCDEYVDRFPITLEKEHDGIKISADRSGLVYQVNATDDDQTISCTNIVRTNLFAECPCGAIEYGPLKLMRPFSSADENPFKMDPVTGDVLIKDSALLEPGETYYLQLQIQLSGITPFALCNLQITAFGSLITSGTGGALTAASFTPDIKENAFLSGVNDRAIIDFGSLMNSAAVNSAGPFTDSTIEINFDASLVSNPAYTNTAANVTAGATYANGTVWLGTMSYNYDMSAGSGSLALNMALTVVGTDPTTALLPGQSIKYKLSIIIPKL
ncbi:uncharacterized protein LOC125178787, partial [Hyalella azteca]|uniref:Uncharacterized protein LOC125178787 n=1 Tax=Hyalella azteca TaxID=294128 RepID=A0A979FT63_HYAAZ